MAASIIPGIDDSERTPCEVWTRVMGYHRPVAAFNPGKQSEHAERAYFEECRAGHHQPAMRQGRDGAESGSP